MIPKICKVIFSTNRIEYLTRTLESQKKIDFTGCETHSIFIDDFPKGRNNRLITSLVKSYGYNEIYLHGENLGLSTTWNNFWSLIRNRDYDYVWQLEDDVEILEPISIKELIGLLNFDQSLSQVKLERQAWYFNETEPTAQDTDLVYNDYRYYKGKSIFSAMASFYPISRVRFPYSDWYKQNFSYTNWGYINVNEGMIGKALEEGPGLLPGIVKNKQGKNLINHIGEYCIGKRVLPNEPHYEFFEHLDPEKKYYSSNGAPYPY